MGLEIDYVQKNIYELDRSFGEFDLVVCGSLLLHLRNIFRRHSENSRGLQGQGHCVYGLRPEPPLGHSGLLRVHWRTSHRRRLLGLLESERRSPTKMLLAAEFSSVSEPVHFTLRTGRAAHEYVVPHVVVGAHV